MSVFWHSELLEECCLLGCLYFPVQKASKHTVKLVGNPLHPSHPFLWRVTQQILLTFLPDSTQEQMSFGFITFPLSQQKCMAGYIFGLRISKEKGKYLFHGWGWTNSRSQGISRDPPIRLWQESFTLSIKYSKLAEYKFYFLFLKDLISPQELSNKSILFCVHWKDGSTQSNCKKKRELERKSQEKCCCPINAYE